MGLSLTQSPERGDPLAAEMSRWPTTVTDRDVAAFARETQKRFSAL